MNRQGVKRFGKEMKGDEMQVPVCVGKDTQV